MVIGDSFFLLYALYENICWGPSFESSHSDGSYEGSQLCVSMRNRRGNPSVVIGYSSYLELW